MKEVFQFLKLPEHNLKKFQRSNQSTCINQIPLVKRGDLIKAGEIIAESAGANIVNLENKIIKYNHKEDYLNPHFLVSNSIETKKEIFSIMK